MIFSVSSAVNDGTVVKCRHYDAFYVDLQDHVLQQTTPVVVVDLLEVVTVIWYATHGETVVLILPRPASHVSAQSFGLHICTRI